MASWPSLVQPHTFNNESKTLFVPLPEYSLLIAQGDDTSKFLQGQCTCDIRDLDKNLWRQGAHCNAKGRMQSSFVAAKVNQNTIGLRLHSSISPQALAALSKYAVFSKVTLSISQNLAVFALLNTNTAVINYLTKNAHTSNTEENAVFCIEEGTVIQHNETTFECWINTEKLPSLLTRLAEHTSLIPPEQSQQRWTLELIRNGIGEVQAESHEKLIPQEMNFQLTNGVSFKKGCYTGQEIIARMHHRAQLKKHMYRGQISATAQQALPELLTPLTNGEGKTVGQIILCAKNTQNQIEFLALTNDDALKQKNITLNTESKPIIEWLALPYAIN